MKLAMRESPSDDHVNAIMHCLDEFDRQFNGLMLESSLTNVKENVVANKGKMALSSHVIREKGRPTK